MLALNLPSFNRQLRSAAISKGPNPGGLYPLAQLFQVRFRANAEEVKKQSAGSSQRAPAIASWTSRAARAGRDSAEPIGAQHISESLQSLSLDCNFPA
jgi:hypothetical protein